MYIAICDHNKNICSQIEAVLLEYKKEIVLELQVEPFYSAKTFLSYIKNCCEFDLIYLNIELKDINGIEVGKYIRKVLNNHRIEIVYISAEGGCDLQIFDTQPLHLILKPLSSNLIIESLNLAIHRLNNKINYFKYKKGSQIFKVEVNQILYFESANRQIRMVISDEEVYFYGKIEKLFHSLLEYGFMRIHRCYLINTCQVRVFEYGKVLLSNGEELPISQSFRKAVRNRWLSES